MADVQSVVQDLLRQAGFTASQVNYTALEGALSGLVISDRSDIRNVVEQLQAFYQFDSIEKDGVLTFIPRGKQSVMTIAEADFLPNSFTITRLPDVQLAEQLNVTYADKASDYQTVTQSAVRQLAPASSQKTVKTNFVLAAEVAKRQADTLLDAVWVERFQLKFSLPLKYAVLEAGDVVTLTTASKTFVVRITRTLYQNATLQVEAVTTDAAAYVQTSAGTTRPSSQIVVATGVSTLFLLDIPLYNEADDSPSFFMAVSKQRDDTSWQYATVYESLDNDVFTPKTVITKEAITGKATTVLSGSAPTAYLDEKNTVTVTLNDGTLASTTDALLLRGANVALLGDELLQFGVATLVGTNTYQLSRLLRARRGTDAAMLTHAINERFVLLGEEVFQQGAGLLNVGYTYKAVSSGQLLDDASEYSFTPSAANLKPLSPVHVAGARDSSGNLTITWIRRSRANGGWQDGVDLPLAEATEQYDVDIMNGATVVRTLTTNSPTTLYTAAQQITDFGSVQSAVTIKIYQRSAVVGRGVPKLITV